MQVEHQKVVYHQRIRNLNERGLYQPDSTAWHLSRALITRFAKSAQAAGSGFVLMSVDETHPELDKLLTALAGELNIGFLDLGPKLRALDTAGIDYRLHNDGHWNATGHRAIAMEIHRYLCGQVAVNGRCELGHDLGKRFARAPKK